MYYFLAVTQIKGWVGQTEFSFYANRKKTFKLMDPPLVLFDIQLSDFIIK